jgi:hypothetical protein
MILLHMQKGREVNPMSQLKRRSPNKISSPESIMHERTNLKNHKFQNKGNWQPEQTNLINDNLARSFKKYTFLFSDVS